jgi:hypothetical protein
VDADSAGVVYEAPFAPAMDVHVLPLGDENHCITQLPVPPPVMLDSVTAPPAQMVDPPEIEIVGSGSTFIVMLLETGHTCARTLVLSAAITEMMMVNLRKVFVNLI